MFQRIRLIKVGKNDNAPVQWSNLWALTKGQNSAWAGQGLSLDQIKLQSAVDKEKFAQA